MNKIHVVIPVYNVEKYLEQAVRSVLDQPYKGIDIVLVDDGSPDNSPAICDRLAAENERVKVIHKENGGLPSARNAGIEYFIKNRDDGYIVFLDADDVWASDTITEELMGSNTSECQNEIMCFDSCRSNNQMTGFSYATGQENRVASPAHTEIWEAQKTLLGTKLYSIAFIDKWKLRFIDGQQYCEDIMFIYQTVFLAESIRYFSECLYIYRGNPSGMMGNILKRDPIDHYGRVVEGWVKCDDFLNQYVTLTNRYATAGYALGNVYLLDMARYHYKRFGKRKRLEEALKDNPHYEGLFKISLSNASEAQVKDRDLLVGHPLLFKAKYNLMGAVEKIARSIKDSRLIAPIWEKRKYPLDHI